MEKNTKKEFSPMKIDIASLQVNVYIKSVSCYLWKRNKYVDRETPNGCT